RPLVRGFPARQSRLRARGRVDRVVAVERGRRLAEFVRQPSQTLTRMSTMVPAIALDADVVFNQPYSGPVPNQRYTQRTNAPGGKIHMAFGAVALLGFAAVIHRRPRRDHV